MRKIAAQLMFAVYSYFFVPLTLLILRIISPFNKKIRESLIGRKKTKNLLDASHSTTGKVVWFHCASLGEYEQAKPIINKLKQQCMDIKIAVTFFSPSGFNGVNPDNIDIKTYLPFDYPHSVKKFISQLNADILILAGYDVWPNIIKYSHKAKIPIYIISARLREGSHRLKPIISFWQKEIYSLFDKVLSVTEDDSGRFLSLGVRKESIKVLGNTRYDQVIERKGETVPHEKEISLLSEGKTALILGSIWKSDMSVILKSTLSALKLNSDLLVIFVPHNPDDKFLNFISSELERENISSIKYSELKENKSEYRVIIVDSIGHLAGVYKFAEIAYLGGGFGPGVHNVMEPAVYGIPVIYGPNLKNSETARYLNEFGGGFIVESSVQYDEILTKLLGDSDFRNEAGKSAYKVIADHSGATEKTVKEIELILK